MCIRFGMKLTSVPCCGILYLLNIKIQGVVIIQEIWKNVSEIPGFEMFSLYEISNFGNVKSLRFIQKDRLLNPKWVGTPNSKNPKGTALAVGLHSTIPGEIKQVKVHRLVALAFIPLVEGKNFINHIDENPENNHFSNLEWVTHKENVNHATGIARQVASRQKSGLHKGANNKRSKPVYGIHKIDGHRVDFPSIGRASELIGQNYKHIPAAIKGRKAGKGKQSAGGYKWFYKEEEV